MTTAMALLEAKMYGLVNKGIEDLAINLTGEQIWPEIVRRAGPVDG